MPSMSLGETVARAAAAVFLVAGQLAVSHFIAARLTSTSAFLARWTAVFVVGMAVATLGFHALAAAQLFTLPAALAAMAALLALVLYPRAARDLWRADLARERETVRRVVALARRSPRRVWIAAFAAAGVTAITRPWIVPPLGWDSVVYHALKAGTWVHAGGLRFLRGAGAWALFGDLPAGGEVFTAWAMLPFHSDTLAMGAETVQLAGVLVAMVALAREIGLREPYASVSAVAFVALPPMRLLTGSGYVEPGMCLAFAGGLVFATRCLAGRGDAGARVLAGAGLGLSMGFKVTMLPIAAAVMASVVVRALASRRARGLAAAAIVFVACGAHWYLYNVIESGRPLTPFSKVVAGVDLGNPTPGVRRTWADLERRSPPYVWSDELRAARSTFAVAPHMPEALGATALVPLAVFLAGWSFWARRRAWVAVPLGLVVALNLAALYGRDAAPLRLLWPESVSRFWLPAFAVLLPASALWCRAHPRAGRAYLWILAAIALYNLLRLAGIYHSSYDLEAQLLLVLAVAGAAGIVWIAPPRGRVAAGVVLAILLFSALDRAVIPRRYQAFAGTYAIHESPTTWVPLARAIDDPERPHRVAVTGGEVRDLDSWFAYGLLGSRLQNDLGYVPVTRDGLIVDDADRLAAVADRESWIERLRARGVEYVVSLQPRTLEIGWMRADRRRFEPVVRAADGSGVWRFKLR